MKDQHGGMDRDSFEKELYRRTIAGNVVEHDCDPVCGCMKDRHGGRSRDSFERNLARQAMAGNRDAYQQLVQHYHDPVFRLCALLVGDFKASDLTGTFFDNFGRIISTYDETDDKIDEREVFKTWFYRQFIKEWKKYKKDNPDEDKKNNPLENRFIKPKPPPEGQAATDQDWWEYMIRLPEMVKATVALVFCDEKLAYEDIGWILKKPDEPEPVSEGTTAWRYSEAKRIWKGYRPV